MLDNWKRLEYPKWSNGTLGTVQITENVQLDREKIERSPGRKKRGCFGNFVMLETYLQQGLDVTTEKHDLGNVRFLQYGHRADTARILLAILRQTVGLYEE